MQTVAVTSVQLDCCIEHQTDRKWPHFINIYSETHRHLGTWWKSFPDKLWQTDRQFSHTHSTESTYHTHIQIQITLTPTHKYTQTQYSVRVVMTEKANMVPWIVWPLITSQCLAFKTAWSKTCHIETHQFLMKKHYFLIYNALSTVVFRLGQFSLCITKYVRKTWSTVGMESTTLKKTRTEMICSWWKLKSNQTGKKGMERRGSLESLENQWCTNMEWINVVLICEQHRQRNKWIEQ